MVLTAAKDLVSKAGVTARSVAVLARAGLVSRPDDSVRSLLAVRRYGPFAGVLAVGATRSPDSVALIDEKGQLTYRQLDNRANALARAWRRRGVVTGTVIAALCRDHRGLITAMAASGKAGAKLLLLNTGFAKPQLTDVVRREGVEHLVYDEEFDELADAVGPGIVRYVSWGTPPAGAEASAGGPVGLEELIDGTDDTRLPSPDQPGGFVLLTSGTTGTPKGAPRERTSPFASAQFLDRIPLRVGQRMFMAAPAFHGTGLAQLLLALALGHTVIMRRRFDPEETLRLVSEHRCQVLVVVPTMLQRILDLDTETLAAHDTSALEVVFAAGSAIPTDVVDRTQRAFGDVLYNLYGSTEVAVATVATPDDLRRAPDTAGRAPVGCVVKLFDDGGHEITARGTTGRIFAGSGLSFTGYTDGRTKEIINGLLATGDVGHFDADGLLFVDGRDDDMIVSGGENVYPLEVENLLAQRPDVREAAVVGVPDEEFGQRLKAYVVSATGVTVDAEELRDYVKANLARYKVPRDVEFLDELPRNATGKLLRNELSNPGGMNPDSS